MMIFDIIFKLNEKKSIYIICLFLFVNYSVLFTSGLCTVSDSSYYKSQAMRNAKEAYQIHQERVSRCLHTLIHSTHTPPVDTVLISNSLPADADV